MHAAALQQGKCIKGDNQMLTCHIQLKRFAFFKVILGCETIICEK